MRNLAVAVVFVALAACGTGETDEENLTRHACEEFADVVRDGAGGQLTEQQLIEHFQHAAGRADFPQADQEVRQAMKDAVAAVIAGSSSRVSSTVNHVADLCRPYTS